MPDNPYLGEYEAYSAQAKKAYEDAMAQVEAQRAGYLQGYGLDAQGRAVAGPGSSQGQYQQMMGSLAAQEEASDAMGRARGFTGGLSDQAMAAARRMSEGTVHQFGQNFNQGLTQFSQAEREAGVNYNDSLYQKMLEITQKSIQDRAFSTPDYSNLPYEPYGDNSPNPGSPGLPWTPPKQNKPKPRPRRKKKGRR